jgi:hypothetical protein
MVAPRLTCAKTTRPMVAPRHTCARDQAADADGSVPRAAGKAPHQIAITTCGTCRRGWQDAAGKAFALPAAAVAQAWCDADVLGRVDGGGAALVSHTVPPATRRQVLRRDRGRCIVPGCRAARHLQVHHVIPRAAGGDHDPRRLATLCTRHHQALHEGKLEISGQYPHFDIRLSAWPVGDRGGDERDVTIPPASPGDGHLLERRERGVGLGTAPSASPIIADAISALRGMGFRADEAAIAVRGAVAHRSQDQAVSLEALVVAALRELRPPAR